jgi:hypothetical protein
LFEIGIHFLSSPSDIWRKGDLAMRKLVVRLAFAELPLYDRETGFRRYRS